MKTLTKKQMRDIRDAKVWIKNKPIIKIKEVVQMKNEKYFIDRFSDKRSFKKPSDIKLKFNLGDIVISKSKGICMIQNYGIYDNQYWVENGIFYQGDYIRDIIKKAPKGTANLFQKKYEKLFKRHLFRFFRKSGFGIFLKMARHYVFINNFYGLRKNAH